MKGKLFKVFAVMLFSTVAAIMLTVSASADSGPKPSIDLTVKNVGSEPCYATMLTDEGIGYRSIHSVGSRDNVTDTYMDNFHRNKEDIIIDDPIYHKFAEYAETDGFIFNEWYAQLDRGDNQIRWGYRTPHAFRLVLYYPESDRFEASAVCECAVFNCFFYAELSDNGDIVRIYEDDNIGYRILSIKVLIAVNLLIELGIAWLFKLRKSNHIITIIIVNVITQGSLIIWLNVSILNHGFGIVEFFGYLLAETFILFAETVAYSVLFRRDERMKYVPLYGFLANIASFLIGSPLAWFVISLL